MKYMLDTNICIYAIKHKPPEVIKNFPAAVVFSPVPISSLPRMARRTAAAILFPAASTGRLFPVWTASAGGKPGEVSRRFHVRLWKPFRTAEGQDLTGKNRKF